MNSTLLKELISFIEKEFQGMHSILIVRNGYIVKEKYFSDKYSQDTVHQLYSCTKSVTSACVGIAVDKGFFDLNDSVLDFFPEKEFANVDKRKRQMTIEDLLQMQSGLDWDEWSISYESSTNIYRQMLRSDDWVKFVLDTPMKSVPGTEFAYNTGVSHLLSAIIQRVTHMTTYAFAEKNLFEPLNITVGYWYTSPDDVVNGGCDLFLTPRDMAKFGWCYLNKGFWDNEQIISKKWVEQSTRHYINLDFSTRYYYGFQWWITPELSNYFTFTARGYRGQWILCIPDLDIVMVCTADSDDPYYDQFVSNYIIPSTFGDPMNTSLYSSESSDSFSKISGFKFKSIQMSSILILSILGIRRRYW
ncbi:MAG: serine hydrolase domain-containing protein [Promethearchaeota archaeon]